MFDPTGKSTFLRQNALIAILAQAGSFVPAQNATVGKHSKHHSGVTPECSQKLCISAYCIWLRIIYQGNNCLLFCVNILPHFEAMPIFVHCGQI